MNSSAFFLASIDTLPRCSHAMLICCLGELIIEPVNPPACVFEPLPLLFIKTASKSLVDDFVVRIGLPQAIGIFQIQGIVTNIRVPIASTDKSTWIFGNKSPHLRVIEPRAVVEHSHVRISLAPGVTVAR